MKCKWAVMSTITSTGEPSTWLLSSQIDELFLCRCPLLTSPGGRVPSGDAAVGRSCGPCGLERRGHRGPRPCWPRPARRKLAPDCRAANELRRETVRCDRGQLGVSRDRSRGAGSLQDPRGPALRVAAPPAQKAGPDLGRPGPLELSRRRKYSIMAVFLTHAADAPPVYDSVVQCRLDTHALLINNSAK